MRTRVLRGIMAMLISTGVAIGGLGLSSGTAQADWHWHRSYHWCPGEFWNPVWGFNWEWLFCHDDWHRDVDGGWHGRDYHSGFNRGGFHGGHGGY